MELDDLKDSINLSEEEKEFPDETTLRIDGEPLHRLKDELEAEYLQDCSPVVEALIFEYLGMDEKAQERLNELQ